MSHPSRKLVVPLVLGILAWTATVSMSSAQETEPRFRGRIVLFGPDAEGRAGVSSMRPDGSDLRTEWTAPNGRGVARGRVSPDLRSLAISISLNAAADRSGWNDEIWIFKDGQALPLKQTGFVGAWSPDSRRLVTTRTTGNERRVSTIIDLDGGPDEELPLPEHLCVDDWSHDGTRLSVMLPSNDDSLHRRIGVYTIDTQTLTPLARPDQTDNIWSRFSPDDRSIGHYRRVVEGEPPDYHSTRAARSTTDGLTTVDLVPLTEVIAGQKFGCLGCLGWPCWLEATQELVWLRIRQQGEGHTESFDLLFVPVNGGASRRMSLPALKHVAHIDAR